MLVLGALGLGRLEALTQFGARAATRLETGRAIPALWGLAAGVLVFLLAAVLFNTHTFALLGALVLAAGLSLAGLGFAVAALSVGTRLTEAFASLECESLGALRLGLWLLGLAAGVPFAGWFFVLLALACGIGSVLETLFGRPSAPNTL